jgi:hypothetical protein
VGAILALAFSQVWWAREPMAESALGTFSWMVGWASVRWVASGGWRWAVLGAFACVAALFTRADAVLLVAAFGLIGLLLARSERRVALLVLIPGIALAVLHDVLVAPIYTSTTYGAVTISRAIAGLAGLGLVAAVALGVVWLRRPAANEARWAMLLRVGRWIRRVAAVGFVAVALAAALSGFAPGLGRAASIGAVSPLAWLYGYVPWPIMVLAGAGVLAVGWQGVPRSLVPLLFVGGLPALLYLPDPLVTGDHPWMVRRLVPAVIPLIAILASIGASAGSHWQGPIGLSRNGETLAVGHPGRMRNAAALAVAVLVGLGLALQIAMDRDLLGPRHAAGAFAGVAELAAVLPPNAVVVFPTGQAGIHLALPLGYDFGFEAFAIPSATMTPEIAITLVRMQEAGKVVYWVEEGTGTPSFPDGATGELAATVHVRYETADGGKSPPPLDFITIDHVVTLHHVTFQ